MMSMTGVCGLLSKVDRLFCQDRLGTSTRKSQTETVGGGLHATGFSSIPGGLGVRPAIQRFGVQRSIMLGLLLGIAANVSTLRTVHCALCTVRDGIVSTSRHVTSFVMCHLAVAVCQCRLGMGCRPKDGSSCSSSSRCGVGSRSRRVHNRRPSCNVLWKRCAQRQPTNQPHTVCVLCACGYMTAVCKYCMPAVR